MEHQHSYVEVTPSRYLGIEGHYSEPIYRCLDCGVEKTVQREVKTFSRNGEPSWSVDNFLEKNFGADWDNKFEAGMDWLGMGSLVVCLLTLVVAIGSCTVSMILAN